jgi:hypothetical protein
MPAAFGSRAIHASTNTVITGACGLAEHRLPLLSLVRQTGGKSAGQSLRLTRIHVWNGPRAL